MDYPPCPCDAAKRRFRGRMNNRLAPSLFGVGERHAVQRDRAERLSLAQIKNAELGLAEPCRVRQYGLEHWLKLARRTGDDLKDFGSRRLLLQRLGELTGARFELLFQLDQLIAP